MSIIDLTQLPPPDVVEALDFERIYQDMLSGFRASMGEGWNAALESDPVVKLLQLAAYRELQVRARVNDAARANLIAFAEGGDLDHAAAFYNVERLRDEAGQEEDDERLRLRTQLRVAALAANGTPEQYRHVALSASLEVRDAGIMPSPPGSVALAVWPQSGADAGAVLADVRRAFAADDAKPLGVPLSVALALPRAVDVTATVYRESTAPPDLVARLREALPPQIAAHARLGRDVPASWISSRLHAQGVSRVQLDSGGVAVAPNEYAAAGAIQVLDGGVAW
ncbi:baseplate assembly protein [Pseudoduganella namucuonensis]|uniref:Phage-related baseplate assembly protein n=1 Tax=Pseudoduganella namucuonensis TaxID=1035707 RepID=A0A1I7J3B0_9BURK|nr:baseplate J/gp47 family protein [Pseudoduganella namucuonensis]SFU79621.1 Phage-related baseplate assembly protein [Pseudoduganella namucuonensis]